MDCHHSDPGKWCHTGMAVLCWWNSNFPWHLEIWIFTWKYSNYSKLKTNPRTSNPFHAKQNASAGHMVPRIPSSQFCGNNLLGWFVSSFALNNSRGLISWPSLGVPHMSLPFQVNNALHCTNLIFLFRASEAGSLTGASMHAQFPSSCLKITVSERHNSMTDTEWSGLTSRVEQTFFFLQSFLLY